MGKKAAALLLALLLALPAHAAAPAASYNYTTVREELRAPVPLEGELVQNAELISVVMPAMVDLIVRVNADGTFRRLYAPDNLYVTNRSDCPVDFSLVNVADSAGKLSNVAVFLSAYSTDGKHLLLYTSPRLAAGACNMAITRLPGLPQVSAKAENQIKLALTGEADAANPPLGADRETFSFVTTFKVTAAAGG
ncbi:hypothetical protein [Allofournierella sp.]|uniref:hypothetical protein n=1 Tax=Allofournierella sp. TaxID=1940256 RepID=UPI003AF04892